MAKFEDLYGNTKDNELLATQTSDGLMSASDKKKLDNLSNILDSVYPVGSIYISVINNNPSTFIGGTWEIFGTGRTLVGIDTNQSEFNIIEKTGGEKTHTLTTNEIPSHNHNASSTSSGAHTHTVSGNALSAGSHNHSASSSSAGSHDHDIYFRRMTGPTSVSSGGWYAIGSAQNNNGGTGAVLSAGSHSHTITVNSGGSHSHRISASAASNGSHTHTITINSTGSSQEHNNLQPYITVYMWKRIS